MKKDHFTSTWLALREPYDILSRNKNLKKFIRQSDRILDIGAGTGAFSRWCLANNIFFENMMLLDHDQRLLNNTQRITSRFCKNRKLIIKKVSKKEFKVEDPVSNLTFGFKTLNKDLSLSINLINNFDVLSMSALIDLLSFNYLKKLFNKIKCDKVIAMTLCFNGKINWNDKNSYDKYIVNEFNREQQSIKAGDISLGYRSIDKVKQLSKKKEFKITIYDSSWRLLSNTDDNKNFHHKYLETLYKPLKRNKYTDNKILEKWYISKIKSINNGSLETRVGHNDIIIET